MTPVRVELLKENLINAGLVHSEEVDPQRPFENIKVLEVGCGGTVVIPGRLKQTVLRIIF